MIGAKQLPIGPEQFITGLATSSYTNDGILDPSASTNINPFITPGVLRSTALAVDKSSGALGNIIATSEDSQQNVAQSRLGVDDAANYYFVDGTGALTKKATGTDAANYKFGFTDMASFKLFTFVSHGTTVAQWNTSGATTLIEDWWTNGSYANRATLDNLSPHPLLNFESLLWIGDGYQLHNIIDPTLTGTSAATYAALVLDSTSRIYALGIDPLTGLMLISFTQLNDISDINSNRYFIGFYDGYSSKLRRKIPVDDLVTSFYNVGGTVYVGYGNSVGIWTGNGIQFLRRLTNVTYTRLDLPYRHHFSSYRNILLVVDGSNVLAYGESIGGTKKAWFPLINPGGSHLQSVAHIGQGTVCFSYATNKWYAVDITSTSTTAGGVVSINNVYFPRPIFARRTRFITTGAAGPQSNAIVAAIVDEKGNTPNMATANRTWVIPSGTTGYVFDPEATGVKLQGFNLQFSINVAGLGVIKIFFYYDVAE